MKKISTLFVLLFFTLSVAAQHRDYIYDSRGNQAGYSTTQTTRGETITRYYDKHNNYTGKKVETIEYIKIYDKSGRLISTTKKRR